MEEHHMSRLHRLVPTVAAALATAALVAPVAQARPAVSGAASGGGNASAVERVVHETPLANPVRVPATGLNHGGGVVLDRTQPITIASSDGTKWVDVFMGAAASAVVIAMCAAGIGFSRRATLAS
jgi:hypothetical protein